MDKTWLYVVLAICVLAIFYVVYNYISIKKLKEGNERMVKMSAIIREGATQKLADVIVGGKALGMQFMDDAIWQKLQQGLVSPQEAYMKAIDKARFKNFLPPEDANLANAGGA